MAILVVVCLATLAVLALLRKAPIAGWVTNHDLVLIVVLLFFFNYNLYSMVPFNASRSNSIIMMAYLQERDGQPVSKSEIEDHVFRLYFEEYDAVQRRLDEQIAAGNIVKVGDRYLITARGALVTELFATITDVYGMDHNFAAVDASHSAQAGVAP